MNKCKKTAENNQWTSLPTDSFNKSDSHGKKEKTAENNQWTSTIKNSAPNKQ